MKNLIIDKEIKGGVMSKPKLAVCVDKPKVVVRMHGVESPLRPGDTLTIRFPLILQLGNFPHTWDLRVRALLGRDGVLDFDSEVAVGNGVDAQKSSE